MKALLNGFQYTIAVAPPARDLAQAELANEIERASGCHFQLLLDHRARDERSRQGVIDEPRQPRVSALPLQASQHPFPRQGQAVVLLQAERGGFRNCIEAGR
ncbi:hypothetical protein GCM10010869_06310 [Mesorhizobium tianshanense]|uniref:Uncharacterized protein n=1 Tax=Mesorhizobium tianshanense TaxID=39844 RepID=A0A562NLZ1_9HYPH|nr:hypothetical protein IQ26_04090 [Mesorhizobium tianshanense]GLS35043.1 hypothetical protein GCM10010869_06310 [Mesorhizobium tianshanense]